MASPLKMTQCERPKRSALGPQCNSLKRDGSKAEQNAPVYWQEVVLQQTSPARVELQPPARGHAEPLRYHPFVADSSGKGGRSKPLLCAQSSAFRTSKKHTFPPRFAPLSGRPFTNQPLRMEPQSRHGAFLDMTVDGSLGKVEKLQIRHRPG